MGPARLAGGAALRCHPHIHLALLDENARRLFALSGAIFAAVPPAALARRARALRAELIKAGKSRDAAACNAAAAALYKLTPDERQALAATPGVADAA